MIHRDCSFQATLKCIAVVMFHMRCNLVVPFPHSLCLLACRREREHGASTVQQEVQSSAFVELKPRNVLFYFIIHFPQISMELDGRSCNTPILCVCLLKYNILDYV